MKDNIKKKSLSFKFTEPDPKDKKKNITLDWEFFFKSEQLVKKWF